ncbi:4a-hydroxytetrahydrobiopterin dehydratase [Streptomyces armeniacus]|uniref:Putative pterin-4-alpha-carbinolamine dehydratase n=1 Tax=Streptomyces armeniacus TaxID=83291 RepID=A0A345XIF2_9ACTN|nr:4a-hydroxytetrahydrobiopterin dehydratase [Streptomyces armeniacus]AXK31418.1 4a-hydroxytetrahydrobiopterin dehydratase [Streptomyces armeniacus]
MAPEPLTPQQTEQALAELPGWEAADDRLARNYVFGKHLPAAAMVIHVAAIQEELGHHSDMTLSYNTLGITVNTHSVGGKITELDVALARRIEEIAAGHGAG